MNKIVSKGIKIDLHIHFEYFKNKDGQKVVENTLKNLDVLIKGLVENEVAMCAITDHDTFNYELYFELKKEELKSNCIYKVLPGIEFSVEFTNNKVIHIVTLFDDKDEEKVKNIEQVMLCGKGKNCFKKTKGAYTRTDYFDAFEFRNIKNEIYNKTYSIENNVEDKLRFVTGSDCYQWKYYPYTEENEKIEFKETLINTLTNIPNYHHQPIEG